jgi:hypothetical protein
MKIGATRAAYPSKSSSTALRRPGRAKFQHPANVAEGKALAQLYREFNRAIVIPDAYFEKMYSSRLARHFYSAEEIDEFKNRWSQSAG